MARRGRKPNLSLRGNILALLGQGPQTVAQCATECGSNPVTAKNHIAAMVDLGLVSAGQVVKHVNPDTGETSRGRPAQLFEITEAGQAALALDDSTVALAMPEPVEAATEAVAEEAASEPSGDDDSEADVSE